MSKEAAVLRKRVSCGDEHMCQKSRKSRGVMYLTCVSLTKSIIYHYMFTTCSLYVLYVFTTYSLYIHCMAILLSFKFKRLLDLVLVIQNS